MIEPLPCPFCKSECIDSCMYDENGSFVDCDDCGAQGPLAHTEQEAIQLWNKRV